MTAGPVTRVGGMPSIKLLLMLGGLVMLAHLLVLRGSPLRLGAKPAHGPSAAHAFSTRAIESAPAVEAAAVVPVQPAAPPARPRPAPRPKIVSKAPAAPEIAGPTAINTIATEAPTNPSETVSTSVAGSATQAVQATQVDPNSAQATAPPGSATVAATPVAAAPPAGPKTTPVTAMSLPGSVRLEYKVTGGSKGLTYYANAELAWRNTGTQYDASLRVSAFLLGARSMTSVGAVTKDGLAPTRFADKFRSEVAAHFETDKGKITFSANTPDAPWIEGTQDRVSVFMQLAGMLAGKPGDFPPGSSITLYTVGPRDADTWTFLVEAEELLQLPAGDIAALKLTRKPRREFDQKVEIWYAPSMNYLPVRNRITQQNGDFIDQQLTGVVRP